MLVPFFALVALSVLVAAAAALPLTWDGSYYLFELLNRGEPFTPHERLINVPVQFPVLLFRLLTDEAEPLILVFSLAYAAVPVVALSMSWLVVRTRTPRLFVWPALGIGMVTLPGQASMISEALISLQLFWPVILAVLLRFPRTTVPIALGCSIAIVVAHPFGMILMGVAAAAGFLVARVHAAEREAMQLWATGFAVAAVLAVLRFASLRTSYETESMSPAVLEQQFDRAVAGIPAAGPLAAYAAGAVLLLIPLMFGTDRRFRRRIAGASALVMAVSFGSALALLVIWAADARAWKDALDYRSWALFASLPLYAMAVADVAFPGLQRGAHRQLRSSAVLGAAVTFSVVVISMSVAWAGVVQKLAAELDKQRGSCVSSRDIVWLSSSPLNHWAVTATSIVIQGRHVETFVAYDRACQEGPVPDHVPVAPWHQHPATGGWFEL